MMKNRTAITSLFACALIAAPVTSAFADGWHHSHYGGGYHGGGPLWGLANAVAATTIAVVTAPIAILAAVAQAPLYYQQGPAYNGAPRGYNVPPSAPLHYGMSVAPSDYRAVPAAHYYVPPRVPPDYAQQAPTYSAPQAQEYDAPRPPVTYSGTSAQTYYPTRRAYYAPRQGYYGPPPDYYARPADENYYSR